MDLIDALRGMDASLLVVGDGPLRARAEQAAGARARFTGSVAHDAMPSYFAAMDLVVVPSRSTPTWKEQFGRIVIEANACGVPVIVSDSGELARTVASTGGGVVVPEGNVEALRAAIRNLLADDERRRALGAAGKAAVARRYSPDAIARELHRFLREVCE
jgi:glycosyltransferase involved in cell wall biosynthesis